MRGPKTLEDGCRWRDRDGGVRDFSPAHYADILAQFDVQVVVRLNDPEYDAADFHASGIAVADLPFDDCTTPPPDVVARFLMLAESLPGALAVHCKAGLGRTGTLIALYLMKHHGFRAREAIGWLRIVRPGSVIGPQQQYLCGMEGAALRAGDAFRRRGPEFAPEHGGVAAFGSRVGGDAGWYEHRGGGLRGRQLRRERRDAWRGGEGPRVGAALSKAGALAAHVAAAAERRGARRIGGPRAD
jgi:hypothetical protein